MNTTSTNNILRELNIALCIGHQTLIGQHQRLQKLAEDRNDPASAKYHEAMAITEQVFMESRITEYSITEDELNGKK